MTVILKWKLLDPEATAPKYMSVGASGMDLKACLADPFLYPDGNMTIKPGQITAIPTGLAVEIPEGCEMQIRPRSGLSFTTKLRIPNAPGTIDSDYRGEIKVLIEHAGWATDPDIIIEHGDRIAQAVVVPVVHALNEYVNSLTDTDRGAGGFGSTGV